MHLESFRISHYTIPSDNRELQQRGNEQKSENDYTIPSDNRELQQFFDELFIKPRYTIPSDNRELQRSNHKAPANENYTIPSDNVENQKSILKLRKNRNQPLHYNKKTGNLVNQSSLFLTEERETGLEPAAPTLARSCSTN